MHSDNGGDTCHAAGDEAPWGSNWPLRGRKMGYFEGGVKVPAFIYSHRLLNSVRIHQCVHHQHLILTLTDLFSYLSFEKYFKNSAGLSLTCNPMPDTKNRFVGRNTVGSCITSIGEHFNLICCIVHTSTHQNTQLSKLKYRHNRLSIILQPSSNDLANGSKRNA